MERKDVLAGGGAEGRSGFLRLPWWCVAGAATYPQNTESGNGDRERQWEEVVQAEHQRKQTVKQRKMV